MSRLEGAGVPVTREISSGRRLAYGRVVPSVLDQTDLVVKRRPQLMEVRGGYDILDQHATGLIGSVEQVGRDNLEKLTHPQRADNARTFFELSDPSGPVLMLTHVQAAHSSLMVARPDGTDVGHIKLENLFGKKRFAIEPDMKGLTLASRTWRNKNFVMVGQGTELASVDMTHGTSGDKSHDNQYAVHIEPGLADPIRLIAFAVVFAVDRIVWTR